MFVIPALGRLSKSERHEFEASLSYRVKFYRRTKPQKPLDSGEAF